MARRPLYPQLPGEQAVDRLLNQTLPNLIQQRQQRQEREQSRQDRLEQQRITNKFTKDSFALREREYEDRQKDESIENVNLIISKADGFADDGDFDNALKLLDRAEIKAKSGKYTKDNVEQFDFGLSRDNINKKKLVEDGFNALDKTWGNASSTPDQIEKANEVFMTDIYPSLDSNERARYRNNLNVYSEGNELKFRALTSPEYDMDSHEAVIDAENTYLKFTPDTLLTPSEFKNFKADLLNYTTDSGVFYDKLSAEDQAKISSEEFLRQYGGKMRANAKAYLSEINKQFVDSDELGRYFSSLPENQREGILKSYGRAVSFSDGVSGEKLKSNLKKRGLSDDFISVAIGKPAEGNNNNNSGQPDPNLKILKKDISEMDEMEQYEEYEKLSKKDFSKLTEKESADFVVLYSQFSDPVKSQEMIRRQGQQSRKTKQKSYLQSRVDRNMNLYNKYRQLLELGPSRGQGKEATYRAPKGMFVGGLIIKKKDLDARMTQLLDAMAKDNTEMSNKGMVPDFLDTEL
jgi:hypothetical protein